MGAFGRDLFIRKVHHQFYITAGWFANEKREQGKTQSMDPNATAAALGATAWIWSPGFVTRAAFSIMRPIALGYTLGSLVGIGISRLIWGKEGGALAADFYTGQGDYEKLPHMPEQIASHYSYELADWWQKGLPPLTSETSYTQDAITRDMLTQEELLQLGFISIDEYVADFNKAMAKMDQERKTRDQWMSLTKEQQKAMVETRVNMQRQWSMMSF